jgi:hypothetical protein
MAFLLQCDSASKLFGPLLILVAAFRNEPGLEQTGRRPGSAKRFAK